MSKIKIIADSKIPYLKGVLDNHTYIEYHDPENINSDIVKDADALIIRTRTHCNKS